MIELFVIISLVSTIIMLLVALIFYIGIIFKVKKIANIDTYNNCNIQIRGCRVISIVFIILSWFLATCKPTGYCFNDYRVISELCSFIACGWIGLVLLGILISVFLNIAKRSEDEIKIMNKLRLSGVVMGVVFLIFSFLLYVG